MTALTQSIDRLAPTRRPSAGPVGYQSWSNLLFLHWRVPAEELADKLPPQLTVDTCQGSAWVGLVLFYMSGVRPWWFPAVPGISNFCETNVRTYVHRDGRDPGVWFFSLDAANSLAVEVARWRWHLNYYRSEMELDASEEAVKYRSRRLWPGPPGAAIDIEAEPQEPIASGPGLPPGQAAPGTLEHFLAERYLLYARGKRGALYCGQVHHRPYPLRKARLLRCSQTLLEAAGIASPGEPDHVLFSDGLDVEIFGLRPVSR